MDNEIAVIAAFKKALRKAAASNGRDFDEYPLGSQDRSTLADDVWTTYDNFAIVESKASEANLSTEATDKTARVTRLCEALHREPDMALLHAKCHRIAWRDSLDGTLKASEYRSVVCAECCPHTIKGVNFPNALTIDQFAAGFFKHPPAYCLSSEDFLTYTRWLTKTVTGTERTIILLASSESHGQTLTSYVSLEELRKLLPKPPSLASRVKRFRK